MNGEMKLAEATDHLLMHLRDYPDEAEVESVTVTCSVRYVDRLGREHTNIEFGIDNGDVPLPLAQVNGELKRRAPLRIYAS